jgi:osmotically-inducible protein OsmY
VAALAAALLPACASTSTVQKAGSDQEITREIMLRYREDPRFEAIFVTCVSRVVTLEGRVDNRLAHEDAVRIARDLGRGSEVVSQIVIRPR